MERRAHALNNAEVRVLASFAMKSQEHKPEHMRRRQRRRHRRHRPQDPVAGVVGLVRISSLLKKPASPGAPAIASDPIKTSSR